MRREKIFGFAVNWRAVAAMVLLFGIVAASGGAPAKAGAATLTAEDRADVARIETYLNKLVSVRAGFIQTTSTGAFAEGRFYLRRPGKLRLDYAPPVKLQIYADGFWLIYVDGELEQANHVPLSASPARVLVAETVRLSGDITVTRIERTAYMIRLYLVQTEEPDAGAMVLVFSDNPLALRQWRVIDAQGISTRISLVNPEFNVLIDDKVFIVDIPSPGMRGAE